jgi:hypothetical protein
VKALIDAGGDPSKVNEDKNKTKQNKTKQNKQNKTKQNKQTTKQKQTNTKSKLFKLQCFRGYYEGKHSINEIREWQARREYPGNAPVMRAVPLGSSSLTSTTTAMCGGLA